MTTNQSFVLEEESRELEGKFRSGNLDNICSSYKPCGGFSLIQLASLQFGQDGKKKKEQWP